MKTSTKKLMAMKAAAKLAKAKKKAVPVKAVKAAPVKAAPVKAAPVKAVKAVPVKAAPVKAVKAVPVKAVPVKASVPELSNADKQAAAEKQAAESHDAPHIEVRLVVGELSVAVDATSLEHTLGAGQWGHGGGLVDTWPDTVWTGLLAHLGLPAFPLDRAVAERPVKRLVQRLWYDAIKGGVPEERATVFAQRDAESAETYKKDLPQVEQAVKAKGERAKAAFGRGTREESHYTPTDLLKDKKLTLGGQAGILLKAFRANGFKPMTTAEATEGMIKAGLVTGTKPERISAFYLSQWTTKRGLLTRGGS